MIKPAIELTRYAPKSLSKELYGKFSLISWNVYKKLNRSKQITYLNHIIANHKPQLLTFQEAPKLSSIDQYVIKIGAYEQYYFSNLQFKYKSFGLLTASTVESVHSHYVLSQYKEFILRTHKAFLVSLYPLSSGKKLMLINIHAINFRGLGVYQKELAQLITFASEHDGPLILAGDFNSWRQRRLTLLNQLMEELSLKKVEFESDRLIKRFFKAPLDHILYRGIKLEYAKVLDCFRLSDHNPMYVEFTV
ncbi:endonuclease/exonuclease/phosphatase family protein [Thiotrichales bacterium 19S9-12]|nr:endonuclease/exonuclease/phosphatase family protein [Thiotrichales bacterium 19S9-11]MCF6811178.1 endonuclease/exonuclease/phosphatase family protein [Thiotrichales bacterium 19S9-12]